MGLLRRIARARLASQVIRRLRRAGVTDARYQAAAFAVRFTRPGADEATVLPLEPLMASLRRAARVRRAAGSGKAAPSPCKEGSAGGDDQGAAGQAARHQEQSAPDREGAPGREGAADQEQGVPHQDRGGAHQEPGGAHQERGDAHPGQRATRRGRRATRQKRDAARARQGGAGRKRPRTESRRARVADFVAGFLGGPELPRSWAEVRPMLRPLLRPAHLRGGIPGSGPDAPLRRARLPFLSEFVVVDQPETMTYVGADQLAGWGVTADEVFAAARGNLSGAVLQGVAGAPVIVQFVGDDNAYWTSHLLLDGWLAKLAGQVGGEPVAFAPDHATLIVAADGSPHLPELFARAEVMYLTSPRAITPMAYVSGADGRTIPYPATPGQPLYDCVRRAEIIQRIQEYARQAETLPGAAELALVDGLRTRAVATPGALLPAADEIDVGGTVRSWSDLLPELTQVSDLDPPRWRL